MLAAVNLCCHCMASLWGEVILFMNSFNVTHQCQPASNRIIGLQLYTNTRSLHIGTASDVGVGLQKLIGKYRVDTVQLDQVIPDNTIPVIADYFHNVELCSQAMGLSPSTQRDVTNAIIIYDECTAMEKCLSLWKQRDPFKATYRALLELLLRLNKTEEAAKVCQYLAQNVRKLNMSI